MMLQDPPDATLELSQLALDVAAQPYPAAMMSRITDLAAKLIDGAAVDLIRITGAGQLRVLASSDRGLSELTEKAWRRWPHIIVHEGRERDTGMLLQRSSYMQQLRADNGIVQELIVPLTTGHSDHGCLRFLFTEPMAASADRALLTAFCAHAAIALDRAALLGQVENLRLALESNREIGAAVGVLMSRLQLTYPQGLHRLQAASQNTNRRLRDVAVEVLYTGTIPQPAADARNWSTAGNRSAPFNS